MYYSNMITALLLSAITAADAFSMQAPVSTAIDKARNLAQTVKNIRQYADPKMFKDRKGKFLSLPKSMLIRDKLDEILDFQISSNIDLELPLIEQQIYDDSLIECVIKGLEAPNVQWAVIEGTPKPKSTGERRSKEWLQLYTQTIEEVIKPIRMPCEGYLYFGNQDYTKILPTLCQCNPFFASALTVSGDNDEYFELNVLGNHKYAKVMKTMRSTARTSHFSVRFNKDMALTQIVNHESGQAVVVPESEWNYYASGVCYSMFYYAQAIQALIHVLHYFMTLAINASTDHNGSLNAWAELYDDNIALKYIEVAAVLYDSSIELPARSFNKGKKLTGAGTENEVTLGGSRAVMDGPMLDILCDWGSFKNTDDFTKKFLLRDIYETAKDPEEAMKAGDILTEFKKHLANVDPFATELTAAMMVDSAASVEKAGEELKTFMSEIGEGVSSIDSIPSFVQLMSCTGMMHGSTLSFTRLIMMPEVMRWMDEGSDVWTKKDWGLIEQTMGTMAGMTPGRHVFTSKPKYGDTDDISDGVKEVLAKFDEKAEALKVAYKKELEKRDGFRELGWILTDHCSDGYDGKQHTVTTYI